jgi:hypothetical protein
MWQAHPRGLHMPSLHGIASALAISLVAVGSAFVWQAATVSHAAPAPARLPFVSWQARIEGRPSIDPGVDSGVFFWHSDPAGLSLRTTDPPGNPHEYKGTITTDGAIRNLDEFRLEPDDYILLGLAARVVEFDLHTSGGVDGLDFDIEGGTGLKLSVQWDDSSCPGDLCSMPPSNLYLGGNSAPAGNNPLWVCRQENSACMSRLP